MTTKSTKESTGVEGLNDLMHGGDMDSGTGEEKSAGSIASMESSMSATDTGDISSGRDDMAAGGMEATISEADDMAVGSMEMTVSEGDDMVVGSMETTMSGGDKMLGGDMGEVTEMVGTIRMDIREEGESEIARFRPPTLPPGASSPAAFEPGVVEVEFRDGVRPQILPTTDASSLSISSPVGVNLSGINQILRNYRLERAESSFQISEQDATQAQTAAQKRGVVVPSLESFVTLHFPANSDTQRIAHELCQLEEVERAVAVPKAIPPQTPLNEPLVGSTDQVVLDPSSGMENQWYIFRCRADRAWDLASGSDVVIADIDWGYRTSHQDLAARFDLSHAYNAYDGGTNVSTGGSVYHGTGVMGIAGGADNNLGMTGFAFDATLWPVQANSGPGTALGGNAWARAIDWVRTANSGGRRKVIILEVQTSSFGNYEMVPSVNAAIRTAIAHDVVVCVAAGNGDRDAGIDDSGNPIQETGSILVGATEYHATQNRRAGFSNFGSRIVVCAPGDSSHDLTCSSSSDTTYRNGFGGTSGATPKVAGTVALMLEINPNLSHEDIRTILNSTGTAVVTDPGKPVGTFLNAEAAVRAAVRPIASGGPIVAWGENRLDAFVIGGNSALYHKWWNGSAWGPSVAGYQSLGGRIRSAPEVVAWGPNRLDIFVVGMNSSLYHKWWNGSAWGPSVTGYQNLGGTIKGDPEVVAWGPNRLDIFVVGSSSGLYHKWWNGSAWGPSVTGYQNLGGTIIGQPKAVAWGPNRLDIFVVGTNSRLYHKWWNGSAWGPSVTGYQDLGGTIVGTPEVVAWGPNRLDIFVVGANSRLYHKWWSGSAWGPSITGYQDLGGTIIGQPKAVAWGPNRLDIFVVGTSSRLYHKWWNGLAWGPSVTGYQNLGGTITSDPEVVAWGPNRLDIFVVGTSSRLYHKWWNGSAWGPSVTGYQDLGGTIINL